MSLWSFLLKKCQFQAQKHKTQPQNFKTQPENFKTQNQLSVSFIYSTRTLLPHSLVSLILELLFNIYPTCNCIYHDRLLWYLVEALSYFSYLLPLSYITFLSSVHMESKHVSFPGNISHVLQRK